MEKNTIVNTVCEAGEIQGKKLFTAQWRRQLDP